MQDTDSDNAVEQKYGAWSLWDVNEPQYQCLSGGKYVTFQLSSVLFGGSAQKFVLLSAINGMQIVISCENVSAAFVILKRIAALRQQY